MLYVLGEDEAGARQYGALEQDPWCKAVLMGDAMTSQNTLHSTQIERQALEIIDDTIQAKYTPLEWRQPKPRVFHYSKNAV